MTRGVGWEQHEGLLYDFTEELMDKIRADVRAGIGEESFGEYVVRTAVALFEKEDMPGIELVLPFLELWADYFLTTRRLERAREIQEEENEVADKG